MRIPKFIKKLDPVLLIPIITLVLVATLLFGTLANTTGGYTFMQQVYQKQLILVGVAAVIFLVSLYLPTEIILSPLFVWGGYLITVLSLILVFTVPQYAGTNRWFTLGNFTIQPSEFAKIVVLLITSLALTNGKPSYLFTLLPIIVLIFLQPDLGMTIIIVGAIALVVVSYILTIKPTLGRSAVVLALINLVTIAATFIHPLLGALTFLVLLFVFVPKTQWLLRLTLLQIVAILLGVGLLVGLYYSPLLAPYQKKRLEPYMQVLQSGDPTLLLNPTIENFHTKQAKIAIGSGGITGKGIQNTTQSRLRFLPEAHTDFIYATISELTGLIGGVSIIILYTVIIGRLLYMGAKLSESHLFEYLYIIGVAGLIMIEVLLALGVNLALLPTKGAPLPFLSYGGSSLLTHSLLIGLALNLYYNTNKR